MIAACELIVSFGALAQFGLAYCRTLLLTCAKVQLSSLALRVAGLTEESWEPREFDRVMCLARLAQASPDYVAEIQFITAYQRLVQVAWHIVAPLSPAAGERIRQELSRCTFFAAVTLDRHLAPGIMLG